jgi:hypothetical protein
MGEHYFPVSSLLPALLITWVLVIVVFVALHWWWMSRNNERQARTMKLMQLPFAARDQRSLVETEGADPDVYLLAHCTSLPLMVQSEIVMSHAAYKDGIELVMLLAQYWSAQRTKNISCDSFDVEPVD